MSLNRRLRRLWKLPSALLKGVMTWLLRALMISNRPSRLARAGFVLPTTVLMILVVALAGGALTYRSYSRGVQAIAVREQQVITNAATPAIDRARAKVEYLFSQDDRFPGGLPPSDVLESMLLNREKFTGLGVTAKGEDIYTLPGEMRVDLNSDGDLDNAWVFETDINGDGTIADDGSELVAYAIFTDDEVDSNLTVDSDNDGDPTNDSNFSVQNKIDKSKAEALVTRTGPVSTSEASNQCRSARAPEGGWQVVGSGSSAALQKNFQIVAFVKNGNDANRTVETLEFQQSRQADRGNKWAAWFRYDMELHAGKSTGDAESGFRWNGAMHTDGSYFVINDPFLYLVSSPWSCIYSEAASEITMSEVDLDGNSSSEPVPGTAYSGRQEFQGQFVRGTIKNDTFTSDESPKIDFYNGFQTAPLAGNAITDNTDSVKAKAGQTMKPSHIAMDPIKLFTEDVTQHRNTATWERDTAWKTRNFVTENRIINDKTVKPFLDDLFRADNRWGPKPKYKDSAEYDMVAQGKTLGENIASTNSELVGEEGGLDGYWERQAINAGTRFIVGQRLQLGDIRGWNYNPLTRKIEQPKLADGTTDNTNYVGSAIYPAKTSLGSAGAVEGGPHEIRQRRSLIDNLSAVQAMAVYHYEYVNGKLPLACMALTNHPGTKSSIINSRTFESKAIGSSTTNRLMVDFFNGKGTNGWEFTFPYTTEATFASAIASDQPLGKALRNLAYFSGDPKGGAPSFAPVQDVGGATGSAIHPYPYLSMWGDHSALRRIFTDYLDKSPGGVTYANLSPADKSTLHTAACTIGMLAYSMQNEILTQAAIASSVNALGTQIWDYISDKGGGNKDMETLLSKSFGTKIGNDTLPPELQLAEVITRNPDGTKKLTKAQWAATETKNNTGQGKCTGAKADVIGTYSTECDAGDYYSQFTLEDIYRALLFNNAFGAGANYQQKLAEAKAYLVSSQIDRDRQLGFKKGFLPSSSTPSIPWDPATGMVDATTSNNVDGNYITGCSPAAFADAASNAPKEVALAFALCKGIEDPKFPALYYVFPKADHDHDGASTVDAQPANEEYIADAYVKTTNPSTLTYKAITNAEIRDLGGGADGTAGFRPAGYTQSSGAVSLATWKTPLPSTTLTSGGLTDPDAANSRFRVQFGPTGSSQFFNVALLDKALFDGRENMSVRVLDIDLKTLSRTRYNGTGDYWMASNQQKNAKGVIYAYREDAVREDEINRPTKSSSVNWGTCDTLAELVENATGNCQTRVTGVTGQDPPLNSSNKISTKPVDFYPDPDRRPFGFRLLNGEDLVGPNMNDGTRRDVGLTFVTDNAAYIQGNFNLHTSTANATAENEEEFKTALNRDTYANFYQERGGLNTDRFATIKTDHWRPSEVAADAVTILSDNFKDGSIADGFYISGSTKGGLEFNSPASGKVAAGTAVSSYQNQNRPFNPGASITQPTGYAAYPYWIRQDGTVTPEIPVWIGRNGNFQLTTSASAPYALANPAYYISFADARSTTTETFERYETLRRSNQIAAADTIVNAILISGILPSRELQGYGGLHNFPRLIENWQDADLTIAGSFFQLNFSTAATGLYDSDAWEPTQSPQSQERNYYYMNPIRKWGYDVALQYLPPSPIAARFVNIGSPRSEYYRELPVDDPYINLLRCIEPGGAGTGRLDPLVSDDVCPA